MAAQIIQLSSHPRARSADEAAFVCVVRQCEELRDWWAKSDSQLIDFYRNVRSIARDYQAASASR